MNDRPRWIEREACRRLRPAAGLEGTPMREQKLPGKPRPRTEVLAEYQAQRARIRPEMWVLRDLFVPPPEEMFRWRVQLTCGCIHERLSRMDQTHPSKWQEREAVTQRRLPKGQVSCRHDDVWSEYQEIASWGDAPKVREFGPDPIEPRDGIDPGTWVKIRRDEPHKAAFWPVELSCGHPADVIVSDLDWKPGDPPRLVSDERAAEMVTEFDEDPTTFDEPRHPGWREHMRRMIELRMPSPQPEQDCWITPARPHDRGVRASGVACPTARARDQEARPVQGHAAAPAEGGREGGRAHPEAARRCR
jgi:hypothetical protein